VDGQFDRQKDHWSREEDDEWDELPESELKLSDHSRPSDIVCIETYPKLKKYNITKPMEVLLNFCNHQSQ
jgi:hypothetical protein